MTLLNRRKFLFRSAAIVAASNLMPGHSIAHLLEPTPREVIVANMKTIEQELMAVGKLGTQVKLSDANSAIIHQALRNICSVGVDRLATPSKEDVAHIFDRTHEWYRSDVASNFCDVPVDVLPVHALKTVLGKWRAPVNSQHEEFKDSWKQFVSKYVNTLPTM